MASQATVQKRFVRNMFDAKEQIMIEQIKRYHVTCDGILMHDGGFVSTCDSTCEVEATEKSEALRRLPNGWESDYAMSYNNIFCPREHLNRRKQ